MNCSTDYCRLRDRLNNESSYVIPNITTVSMSNNNMVANKYLVTNNGIPLKHMVSSLPYIFDGFTNDSELINTKAMTPLRESKHSQTIRDKTVPSPRINMRI